MITKNSLKTLKTELNELIKVIDINLSTFSEREKLFDTQSDYYEALRLQNKVPQDYYKFRFFDSFIYIYYNITKKEYEIHIEDNQGRYYIHSHNVSFKSITLDFIECIEEVLHKEKNKLLAQMELF